MDIKETVQELLAYYSNNRQVGHTTSIIKGAKKTNATVLVHDQQMSEVIRRQFNHTNIVSLGSLNKLRGSNQPLVIDNATLHTLFVQILDELSEKEVIERKFKKIKHIVNE